MEWLLSSFASPSIPGLVTALFSPTWWWMCTNGVIQIVVYSSIIIRVIPTQWALLSGVCPLWILSGCFASNIDNFFPLVVHAWRYCLNTIEEQPILVHRGLNLFYDLLAYQNEFNPQCPKMDCSLCKPPHYLRACTKSIPNKEGVVFKTSNSTKSPIELKDNSIITSLLLSGLANKLLSTYLN